MLEWPIRKKRQGDRLVDQRPCRTRRHAFPTGDAGGLAHRHVGIKGDAGRISLAGTPNDIVTLHLVTGTNTAIAQDAGIVVHLNHR